MPSQDVFHCVGAPERVGKARTRVEQDFNRCGIIPVFPIPSVLRSVERPIQWRDLVIVIVILDRRVISQDQPNQFGITVPRSPVQRRRMVLSETLHWKTRY